MKQEFFTALTDALMERYPEKKVNSEQITGAIKTSIQTESLINALAEVFRLSPSEIEAALTELGMAEMIAQYKMGSGNSMNTAKTEKAALFRGNSLSTPFDALFSFHSAPDCKAETELPEGLHAMLRELSEKISANIQNDPFIALYREGVADYYEDFMLNTAPIITAEIERLFGENGPKYLVTTGIGANEQFCHYAAKLNNSNPGRKLTWICIHSPGQLSLLPEDASAENTLFMEFSRSSVTEETIKLHEYTDRSCRRIVFTNGGGLKKLAERDDNLVLRMPDEISGRYGRNKTPILLAPMLAAGMDTDQYWADIEAATEAFALDDPDSLPYVMARFILAFQKARGTDFIYLGCGDDTLAMLADEFIQFWNEGVNKNGNDLLVSRFFGLPRDSHMNLEGVLGNKQTKLGLFLLRSAMPGAVHPLVHSELDAIDEGHCGLKLGDEETILALANYKRFAELMPTMLLEVKGVLTMEHSAVLGQLFADVTFIYSRMMGIDPGSNPEVKFVRERSAKLLKEFAAKLRAGERTETLFEAAVEA